MKEKKSTGPTYMSCVCRLFTVVSRGVRSSSKYNAGLTLEHCRTCTVVYSGCDLYRWARAKNRIKAATNELS